MATATGTSRTAPRRRGQTVRVPRTTGLMSGALIMLLGVWGALIPFVGPYFHYAFGGFQTWHYTSQRLWLCIVPGAAAVIGGLMLMRARTRVGGLTAGWVALAAGVWFAAGPSVSLLWHHSIYAIGTPAGGSTRQMLEWVGYFYGLGAAIIGLAAFAMGRYFSRPRIAEEPVMAAEAAPVAGEAAAVHAAYARPAEEYEADREAYDRPAEEYEADREAHDRPADAPVADHAGYEEPIDTPATRTDARATATEAPATEAPATDAPATDAPATGVDAPATRTDATATTSYRRRPGLLRRLRG